MELPVKKKFYSQKYRKEWENNDEFKGWLVPVTGNELKGMCRYCHTEFNAKICDIKKHAETKKHKLKMNIKSSQQVLPVQKKENIVRHSSKAEASLALFITEHSSILTVEHLAELCKNVFQDSKFSKDIQLHRTKCSNIITEVLGPHFKEMLRSDIGHQKYSLILDESTDISVIKYLGIAIRYFSESQKKIVSTFLSLTPIENADAKGLANAIVETLGDHNLELENLIGIGTDNASVMTGVNNGLHQILVTDFGLTNLILVRCVCHSLQLAVSHASENTLPRNVEYMIRETYNWFCLSPKRQGEYKNIYETLNCGKQPLKILKICTTRWLSINPAVTRILQQWEELKFHFSICKTRENCYTAELLHSMYEDPRNLIYLTYIESILGEVQTSLKVFESENADPTKLLDSLTFLLKSISNKVIYQPANINVLTTKIQENHLNPYTTLGYAFENCVNKLNLPRDDVKLVKTRCIEFTVKLIKELQNRLPPNIEILTKMNRLSVSEVLRRKTNDDGIIELANELGYKDLHVLDKISQQYNNINFIPWEHIDNTSNFWAEVHSYKDAIGENPFAQLCTLALNVLSLPHSNADIERIFSTLNIIKTKQRNRMGLKTVNSILSIKYGLKRINKKCCDYVFPPEILKLIGSNKSYSFTNSNSTASDSQPSTSTASTASDVNLEYILDDSDEDY